MVLFDRSPRAVRPSRLLHSLSFAGLVVLARSPNPIPSRTRPLNSSAPMVLSLKTWESRSLPGLRRTDPPQHDDRCSRAAAETFRCGFLFFGCGLVLMGTASTASNEQC